MKLCISNFYGLPSGLTVPNCLAPVGPHVWAIAITDFDSSRDHPQWPGPLSKDWALGPWLMKVGDGSWRVECCFFFCDWMRSTLEIEGEIAEHTDHGK